MRYKKEVNLIRSGLNAITAIRNCCLDPNEKFEQNDEWLVEIALEFLEENNVDKMTPTEIVHICCDDEDTFFWEGLEKFIVNPNSDQKFKPYDWIDREDDYFEFDKSSMMKAVSLYLTNGKPINKR